MLKLNLKVYKMYSEITEALFKSIVTKETKCINAVQLDHAFKTMFFVMFQVFIGFYVIIFKLF